MRAIIIDAKLREVREKEISGDLKSLQAEVGGLIEPVQLSEQEVLFVNEEGLLLSPQAFFEYAGAHQPFAGSGVIVGENSEGETVATTLTLEEVRSKVKFVSLAEVQARYAVQ